VSQVTVNGDVADLAPGTTVTDLVAAWCVSAKGVAVAVNGEVVPGSAWTATAIRPGDQIEIVTATAGG
jgi:sulfur carrier protein